MSHLTLTGTYTSNACFLSKSAHKSQMTLLGAHVNETEHDKSEEKKEEVVKTIKVESSKIESIEKGSIKNSEKNIDNKISECSMKLNDLFQERIQAYCENLKSTKIVGLKIFMEPILKESMLCENEGCTSYNIISWMYNEVYMKFLDEINKLLDIFNKNLASGEIKVVTNTSLTTMSNKKTLSYNWGFVKHETKTEKKSVNRLITQMKTHKEARLFDDIIDGKYWKLLNLYKGMKNRYAKMDKTNQEKWGLRETYLFERIEKVYSHKKYMEVKELIDYTHSFSEVDGYSDTDDSDTDDEDDGDPNNPYNYNNRGYLDHRRKKRVIKFIIKYHSETLNEGQKYEYTGKDEYWRFYLDVFNADNADKFNMATTSRPYDKF